MDKKELRKKYTKIRAEVKDKEEKDKLIREKLRELDIYKKAEDAAIIDKIINFFSSIIKSIADSFDSNK